MARGSMPWWSLVLRHAAALVGVLAAVLSVIGSWVPSYWGDEAASVMSAGRPLPSLMGMLARIDAVHGAYYLFLHGWMQLVGTSEFAVRFPSAIAIGLAAAGVVVLGSRLLGPTTGLIGGLVFAVLPIATRMGMEARSYAFAMAAAVWLTVWLVSMVRRRESGWWEWALFALGLAAGVYVFLYLALLPIVHAAVVLGARAPRAVLSRWLAASVTAALLAAPIMLIAMSQREQVAFLARRDYATPYGVFIDQWFAPAWPLAVAAWALMAIAVIAAFTRSGRSARFGTLVAVVWAIAPTVLLLAGNLFTPLYNNRYLAFCAPAVALLMAAGIRAVAASVARIVAARPGMPSTSTVRIARAVSLLGLGVVIALAVPAYVAARGPYAKDGGSDLRQSADLVAAHAASGDAIVFDEEVKPSRRPRLALDLYPDRFAHVADVQLLTPYPERDHLWDEVAPIPDVAERVLRHERVWAVEVGDNRAAVEALQALGYRVEQELPVHRTTVFELVRENA